MISVRSMLQKFAEALASRSREGTANVLPLETSIRFPCVTYPKDVSNETAVTVTICRAGPVFFGARGKTKIGGPK